MPSVNYAFTKTEKLFFYSKQFDLRDLSKYFEFFSINSCTDIHELMNFCIKAREAGFAAVTVEEPFLKTVRKALEGSETRVCCLVDAPFGNSKTSSKKEALIKDICEGATELDIFMNTQLFRIGFNEFVEKELSELIQLAHSRNALVKVVVEMSLLNSIQKISAAQMIQLVGADFIKTGSGFLYPAKIDDLKLIKKWAPKLKIAVGGGIISPEIANEFRKAGAERICVSKIFLD